MHLHRPTKSSIHTKPPHKQKVNLITSFNIIKASVRAMLSTERAPHGHKQQQQPGSGSGGAIVFTSAALASHGLPNYEAMSAAKAGVEGTFVSA